MCPECVYAFAESNPDTPPHKPVLVVQPEAELHGIVG
jgi:hypothetical protein